MNRVAWSSAISDRTAAFVKRSRVVAGEISERYVSLGLSVAPGGSNKDDGSVRTSRVDPAIPVRIDVLDLTREIETFAKEASSLVRGALRMGFEAPKARQTRPARTVTRLDVVARHLDRLWVEDPELGRSVSIRLWDLWRDADRVLGLTPRPFRIDEACPQCGGALLVSPETAEVVCLVSDCRSRFPVNVPLLVHTAGG